MAHPLIPHIGRTPPPPGEYCPCVSVLSDISYLQYHTLREKRGPKRYPWLFWYPWGTIASNGTEKSHYQSEVFVCVSTISRGFGRSAFNYSMYSSCLQNKLSAEDCSLLKVLCLRSRSVYFTGIFLPCWRKNEIKAGRLLFSCRRQFLHVGRLVDCKTLWPNWVAVCCKHFPPRAWQKAFFNITQMISNGTALKVKGIFGLLGSTAVIIYGRELV